MPPDDIHSIYGVSQIDELLVHYGEEIIVSIDNGDRMSHGPMIVDDLRTEFKFFKEHLVSKGFCFGKVGGDEQPRNNDVFHCILTDTQCKKWFQCIGLLIEIKMVQFLQTGICVLLCVLLPLENLLWVKV